MPFFERVVGRFYEGVAVDPVLSRVYPEADLAGAERRLTLFFAQYWGGPRTYDAERGHPRLRMRHAPFVIGPIERDAWLRCAKVGVDSVDLAPEHREQLWAYLEMAANSMMNAWV